MTMCAAVLGIRDGRATRAHTRAIVITASVIKSGLCPRDAPAAARSTTADSKRTRMLRG